MQFGLPVRQTQLGVDLQSAGLGPCADLQSAAGDSPGGEGAFAFDRRPDIKPLLQRDEFERETSSAGQHEAAERFAESLAGATRGDPGLQVALRFHHRAGEHARLRPVPGRGALDFAVVGGGPSLESMQSDERPTFVRVDAHLHTAERRAQEVEALHEHAPAGAARQGAPMTLHVDESVGVIPDEEGAPEVDPPISEHPVEALRREVSMETEPERATFRHRAVGFADDGGEAEIAQLQRLLAPVGDEIETSAERQVTFRTDRFGGEAESAEPREPGFAQHAQEATVRREGDFDFAQEQVAPQVDAGRQHDRRDRRMRRDLGAGNRGMVDAEPERTFALRLDRASHERGGAVRAETKFPWAGRRRAGAAQLDAGEKQFAEADIRQFGVGGDAAGETGALGAQADPARRQRSALTPGGRLGLAGESPILEFAVRGEPCFGS